MQIAVACFFFSLRKLKK